MPTRLPNASERLKRGRLTSLLAQGKVLIQVDTRHDEVDVPEEVSGLPMVSFRLSHRFQLDVFEIGPLAVVASLSFDQGSHRCVFPWDAIFGMTAEASGETAIFEESAPSEYLTLIQALQEAQQELAQDPSEAEEAPEDEEPVMASEDNAPPSPTTRSHLTLVES